MNFAQGTLSRYYVKAIFNPGRYVVVRMRENYNTDDNCDAY